MLACSSDDDSDVLAEELVGTWSAMLLESHLELQITDAQSGIDGSLVTYKDEGDPEVTFPITAASIDGSHVYVEIDMVTKNTLVFDLELDGDRLQGEAYQEPIAGGPSEVDMTHYDVTFTRQ